MTGQCLGLSDHLVAVSCGFTSARVVSIRTSLHLVLRAAPSFAGAARRFCTALRCVSDLLVRFLFDSVVFRKKLHQRLRNGSFITSSSSSCHLKCVHETQQTSRYHFKSPFPVCFLPQTLVQICTPTVHTRFSSFPFFLPE